MKRKKTARNQRYSTGDHYTASIDLHGLRQDEAVIAVQQFLLAHPNSSLEIVHGNGQGILRNRIRSMLASGKLSNRYFFPGEDIGASGSDGVTIVFT